MFQRITFQFVPINLMAFVVIIALNIYLLVEKIQTQASLLASQKQLEELTVLIKETSTQLIALSKENANLREELYLLKMQLDTQAHSATVISNTLPVSDELKMFYIKVALGVLAVAVAGGATYCVGSWVAHSYSTSFLGKVIIGTNTFLSQSYDNLFRVKTGNVIVYQDAGHTFRITENTEPLNYLVEVKIQGTQVFQSVTSIVNQYLVATSSVPSAGLGSGGDSAAGAAADAAASAAGAAAGAAASAAGSAAGAAASAAGSAAGAAASAAGSAASMGIPEAMAFMGQFPVV